MHASKKIDNERKNEIKEERIEKQTRYTERGNDQNAISLVGGYPINALCVNPHSVFQQV